MDENRLIQSAKTLIELASQHHVTVCSCESFTAGLFCAVLGSVPGAFAVLKGGLVTYFSEMKVQLAHVDPQIIEQYGVVSSQCAKAMAQNTRNICEADYCVSFTGNAGPSSMEGKPAGLIYSAIASPSHVKVFEKQLSLPRNELRKQAVLEMIEQLIELIEQNHPA